MIIGMIILAVHCGESPSPEHKILHLVLCPANPRLPAPPHPFSDCRDVQRRIGPGAGQAAAHR
jgi:hypothetical protein